MYSYNTPSLESVYQNIMHTLTGVLIVMLIVLAIVYIARQNSSSVKTFAKGIFGGYKPFKFTRKPTGIVLGKLPFFKIYICSPAENESHVCVLAPSGGGKTVGPVLCSLNASSSKMTSYVIDVSGDIHPNVYSSNKKVFAPFEDSDVTYNVFAAIDTLDSKAEQDAELIRLAITIYPTANKDSDASVYYYQGGLAFLQGALVAGYHAGCNFAEICSIIRRSSIKELFDLISKDEVARGLIASYIDQTESNLAGCKDRADKAVEIFALNPYINRAFSSSNNEVSPATLETNSLYICIPDTYLALCEQVMHVITSQVVDYLMARPFDRIEGHKIFLCLDEMTSLGHLDALKDLLSRSRKHGVRIMIITQSLADFEMIYPREHRSMLENMTIKVILGAAELDSMEYFSRMLGSSRDTEGHLHKNYLPEDFGNLSNRNRELIVYPGGYIEAEKTKYFKIW